ncbi:uncharacterized protein J3R85_015115 [Psidium guajava]|nr:uncharacterized protein J3R85_015115 [Psidium guajava]
MSSESEGSGNDPPVVHLTGRGLEPNESQKQLGVDRGRLASSHELALRAGHQDKQTGNNTRARTKHTFSSGDICLCSSTGRVGSKDEHEETSTVRVGNKSGDSEYEVQERLRTITFSDGCEGSRHDGKGYNNSLTQKKN